MPPRTLLAGAALLALAACSASPAPSGQSVMATIASLQGSAGAAIQKFNAHVGLTPAEVQTLCTIDNAAHAAVQLGLMVSPVPAGSVALDNGAHAAIQAACVLAETGKMPSSDQIAPLAQDVQAALAAIGGKL